MLEQTEGVDGGPDKRVDN